MYELVEKLDGINNNTLKLYDIYFKISEYYELLFDSKHDNEYNTIISFINTQDKMLLNYYKNISELLDKISNSYKLRDINIKNLNNVKESLDELYQTHFDKIKNDKNKENDSFLTGSNRKKTNIDILSAIENYILNINTKYSEIIKNYDKEKSNKKNQNQKKITYHTEVSQIRCIVNILLLIAISYSFYYAYLNLKDVTIKIL